jgi:D-3-phosphoglycerate dehydrogenase / 2-oxoglutarate reductase
MKKKIAILDTGYESYQYESKLFYENGYSLELFPGAKDDWASKIKFASDALGLLIRFTEINEYFLNHCPFIKAIVRYGAGYENINLEACTHRNILCANVRGYGNHAVSDHALAMLLSCLRQLPSGSKYILEKFGEAPDKFMPELHQMTLGIIGLGRIGGTMATKCRNLFKKIIAYDPFIGDEVFQQIGTERVDLDTLVIESDAISIHCNLTPEAVHLLDHKAFSKMNKRPVVINTARGQVIDENALLYALDHGLVQRVGLDVFHTEIPNELPDTLLRHPSVLCSGHYAWYSENSHVELQKRAANNLLALLQGQNIEDCLNPLSIPF